MAAPASHGTGHAKPGHDEQARQKFPVPAQKFPVPLEKDPCYREKDPC